MSDIPEGVIARIIAEARRGRVAAHGGFRTGLLQLWQLKRQQQDEEERDALARAVWDLRKAEDPTLWRDSTPEQMQELEASINGNLTKAGRSPLRLQDPRVGWAFSQFRSLMVDAQGARSRAERQALAALYEQRIRGTVGSRYADEGLVDFYNASRAQSEAGGETGQGGRSGERGAGSEAEGAPGVMLAARGLTALGDLLNRIADSYGSPFSHLSGAQQRRLLEEKREALPTILGSASISAGAKDAAVEEVAEMERAILGQANAGVIRGWGEAESRVRQARSEMRSGGGSGRRPGAEGAPARGRKRGPGGAGRAVPTKPRPLPPA